MREPAKTAAPYGLKVIDSCFACVLREEGLFCRLSPEALRDLNALRHTVFYPAGALLFVEGEAPRGLFVLCSGQAKLAANSRDGKSITLRLVEPGELLGLSSVVANGAYPATAETLAPCQVNFIPRPEFMQFLHRHAEVSVRVAEHLSMELHKAWEQTRLIALAPSARAKLAQLLLEWGSVHGQKTANGLRLQLNLTREEIGETIGASRETVSRLLADFRRRRLIRIKGGSITLVQPEELRVLSGV